MPNIFLSKLFLIVIQYQVVLNHGMNDCEVYEVGNLRLRGGPNIAGLVQICVQEKWLNVCSDGWGQKETIAVCECQMESIDNCNIGWLEYNSHGDRMKVSVHNIPEQDCSSYSTVSCNSDNSVFVICDLSSINGASITTSKPICNIDSDSDGETTMLTTDVELSPTTFGKMANKCKAIGALAGVLGGTIVAMMGVFLGLVWYYQRKLQKIVHTYSNRRNSEHGRNPESRYDNTHSSNYTPSMTQESTYRTNVASALPTDQQSQSHILADYTVLYHTIREPRNRQGTYETITDERDVTGNYNTLEKVQSISTQQHYEFDSSEVIKHSDGNWDHDYNTIDETEMNVAEYSGAEHAQKEAEYHTLEAAGTNTVQAQNRTHYSTLKNTIKTGQVGVGAQYDTLDATGKDTGHAQKEYYDNTLESTGNDTRHAHGMTADKNDTTATSGACKEIPGRNVSNYDSLQHY